MCVRLGEARQRRAGGRESETACDYIKSEGALSQQGHLDIRIAAPSYHCKSASRLVRLERHEQRLTAQNNTSVSHVSIQMLKGTDEACHEQQARLQYGVVHVAN